MREGVAEIKRRMEKEKRNEEEDRGARLKGIEGEREGIFVCA